MSGMPTPREVFESADLPILQGPTLEREHFERKEAPTREQAAQSKGDITRNFDRMIGEVQDKIKETICAFAVSNQDPNGGLFVMGIDDDGVIRGLKHLDTRDLERLLDLNKLLENVHFLTKRVDCTDATGDLAPEKRTVS